MTTLALEFKKIHRDDKILYSTFYLNSKAETFNESDINDVFVSIYNTIIWNIQKSLGQHSGWIVDSVQDDNINISRYNRLAARSCIELPKELDHSRKGLINIQNIDDNECLKWYLVRYLNHADCNSVRITKADKYLGGKKNDLKVIKFPVKIRDIYKNEKTKNSIDISIFG